MNPSGILPSKKEDLKLTPLAFYVHDKIWTAKPMGTYAEAYDKLMEAFMTLEKMYDLHAPDARRYRKLWRDRVFVPSKTPNSALFSFRCWCEKEQGDAAIDAAIEKERL